MNEFRAIKKKNLKKNPHEFCFSLTKIHEFYNNNLTVYQVQLLICVRLQWWPRNIALLISPFRWVTIFCCRYMTNWYGKFLTSIWKSLKVCSVCTQQYCLISKRNVQGGGFKNACKTRIVFGSSCDTTSSYYHCREMVCWLWVRNFGFFSNARVRPVDFTRFDFNRFLKNEPMDSHTYQFKSNLFS